MVLTWIFTSRGIDQENIRICAFLLYEEKTVWSRNSHPEVLIGKGVLKICSKFTRDHPCWSVISHSYVGYSPVNLLHIFRTPLTKNNCGGLLLLIVITRLWSSLENYTTNNTTQHETTRHNAIQHEYNMTQRETTQVQDETTWV